jgi:hypothetical protein
LTPLTACPSFTCSKVYDLQVFGEARAPLNADKAERVSPQFFQTGKRGDSAAPDSGIEVLTVPNQAAARALEPDIVSRLARFFPDATPVRIPIKLSRTMVNANGNRDSNGNGDLTAHGHENENVFFQDTVIEFGTPHEVLFALDRPLQFADRVLVESNDGSLHAEAFVVAVQYHLERTAVAVRFLKHVPNWIVKS